VTLADWPHISFEEFRRTPQICHDSPYPTVINIQDLVSTTRKVLTRCFLRTTEKWY